MKTIPNLLMLMLATVMILAGTGCKKDTDDPDNNGNGDSFANKEYAGTALVGNHYWPRPLSIRFDGNRNVSAWSNLVLNKYNHDVTGKVTQVETDPQGGTVLTVLWNLPGEEQFNSPQTYTIPADGKTISGGTNPLYVMNQLPLAPTEVKKVVGTWEKTGQPGWYPDVNATMFLNDGFALYYTNGDPVMSSFDPTDVNRLRLKYTQDGTRITFSGTRLEPGSPPQRYFIPYYGVLSADGNTLYVDALEYTYARLPSSFQTFDWNGPKGITPNLQRL